MQTSDLLGFCRVGIIVPGICVVLMVGEAESRFWVYSNNLLAQSKPSLKLILAVSSGVKRCRVVNLGY